MQVGMALSPNSLARRLRRDQQRSGWLDEPDQKAGDFDEPNGRERGGLLVIIGIDMDQRGPRASMRRRGADLCGQLRLHQPGVGTGKRCHAGDHDGWPSELVALHTGGATDRRTGELGHPVIEPGHVELGRQPGPGHGGVIAEGCHLQGHEPVTLVGADPADLNSPSMIERPQPGLGPLDSTRPMQRLTNSGSPTARESSRGTRRPHGRPRDPYQTLSASRSTCSWVTSALFHFGILMLEAMARAPRTTHTPPP
jgi:hypothetical protein